MKQYSQWKDGEVKKLFEIVENCKMANQTLLDAFRQYANKTRRKTNSVRNYYYQEIERLNHNSKRAEKLQIDINKHQILQAERFSIEQTEKLVTEILRLKCMGMSTRKACLKLANNSITDMVRYQNKFRSVIKGNKELHMACLEKLRHEGLKSNISKQQGNVVYMKKQEQKKLTDEDVNSLFLGLIKLVKKTAIESLEKDLLTETEFANETLRQTLVKLSQTEKQLQEILEKNGELTQKCERLTDENISLKTRIAHFMSEKIMNAPNKNKSLATYLKEMRAHGQEIKTKI